MSASATTALPTAASSSAKLVSECITVFSRYHNKIIGKGGKNIQMIKKKSGIKDIRFPSQRREQQQQQQQQEQQTAISGVYRSLEVSLTSSSSSSLITTSGVEEIIASATMMTSAESATSMKVRPLSKIEKDQIWIEADNQKSIDTAKKLIRKLLGVNYFLSLRIDDVDIRRKITAMQQDIIQAAPAVKPHAISPLTLHITVLILGLYNDEEIERAKKALALCRDIIARFYPSHVGLPKIQLRGLSHFNERVVFADIVDNEDRQRLVEFANEIQKLFAQESLVAEEYSFVPHATVFKIKFRGGKQNGGGKRFNNNNRWKRNSNNGHQEEQEQEQEQNGGESLMVGCSNHRVGDEQSMRSSEANANLIGGFDFNTAAAAAAAVDMAVAVAPAVPFIGATTAEEKELTKIRKELWSSYAETDFGMQRFTHLELSSMDMKKATDGYYACIDKIALELDVDITQPPPPPPMM